MSRLPEAFDDVDDELLQAVFDQYRQDNACFRSSPLIADVDREKQWVDEQDAQRAQHRAARAGRLLSDQLQAQQVGHADFFRWSRRQYDRQDFDYLLHHRHRLDETIKEHLEIVAAKITHLNKDGSDGYFNKLERNIGWTPYITPIIFSKSRHADSLVRCGLWLNSQNSGRCHKTDYCPNCHWNDILKVLVEAFGSQSGAFGRAPAWSFITCGFTTSQKNSTALGRGLDPEDFQLMRGDHLYDPYPVLIGTHDGTPDCEFVGYNDARMLAVIIQEALDELYQAHYIDGYRNKLEGAFKISAGGAKGANIHGHTIANGSETNMQFLAEDLHASMKRGLQKHARLLNRHYHPNVLVLRIASPEDLQRCIVYTEKIVAVDKIVADAMKQPNATGPDGKPSPEYVRALDESLRELIDDDMENIFTGFWLDRETRFLRRRKTVGNMQFSDDPGFCIGDEPDWNVAKRHKAAHFRKEARAAKRKRDAELGIIRVRKPQKRRRKRPRRLSRSLQRRKQPCDGGSKLAFDLESTLRIAARRVALSLGPSGPSAPPHAPPPRLRSRQPGDRLCPIADDQPVPAAASCVYNARSSHSHEGFSTHVIRPPPEIPADVCADFVLHTMMKEEFDHRKFPNGTLHSRVLRRCTAVEIDLVRNSALSPTARLLYTLMTTYTEPDNSCVYPGEAVSRSMGLSERTLRKYEVELERHGWLSVERHRSEHGRVQRRYSLLAGPALRPLLLDDED
jgi:hypothetical protein